LEKLISDEHLSASGDPVKWTNESHNDTIAAWVDDGGKVDQVYFDKEIKVVDQRLALAGLRLAALLNDTFKNKSPKEFK
jgi:hypothetical protein